MEHVKLASDVCAESYFVDWLKERYPNVTVETSDEPVSFIDGLPDCRRVVDKLWDEFSGYVPESERPAAILPIEHIWDGEFWEAHAPYGPYCKGYGHTPEQATEVLMLRLEGRKTFWSFNKLQADFSELGINHAIVRAIVKHGVYTTAQLRGLTRLQAKLLDVILGAKGRILYWHGGAD